jgi:hypothetical protein
MTGQKKCLELPEMHKLDGENPFLVNHKHFKEDFF